MIPDLRPILALGAVGVLALIVGIPYGLWWVFHHISFH
jgi:hypothetical protein